MKQIENFKQLIEEKKYYEAHEALEEVWFPIRHSKNNCSLVLKGFINGAVSLELNKRDKLSQSKNVYNTYLKYTTQERIESTNNKDIFKNLKKFMDKKFQENFTN
jgi:hypothetical protein